MVNYQLLQLFDQEFKHSLDRLKNLYVDGDITNEAYSYNVDTIKSRQKSLNEARQAYIIDQLETEGRIYAIKNPLLQLFDQEFKLRQNIKDAYIEKCTNNLKVCKKITYILQYLM